MLEFTIKSFIPIDVFDSKKPAVGVRPLVLFQGALFDTEPEYRKLQLFFLDFFRGEPIGEIDHARGLQHCISITADTKGAIHIRAYVVDKLSQKAGGGGGEVRVDLVESGPAMELELKRRVFCPDAIMKVATYVPKELKPTKVKNVGIDAMGARVGRIHMKTQDLTTLQTRKMKGLRKRSGAAGAEDHEGNKKQKVETEEQR